MKLAHIVSLYARFPYIVRIFIEILCNFRLFDYKSS